VDVEASPFECRFYNAYFSILSSLVSFVIPCCVVMFVYVRIIIALKRREKAAKQRKAVSVRHLSKSDKFKIYIWAYFNQIEFRKNEEDGHEKDAAGEIVAAPGNLLFFNDAVFCAAYSILNNYIIELISQFYKTKIRTFALAYFTPTLLIYVYKFLFRLKNFHIL
jgi:hypothetical protein